MWSPETIALVFVAFLSGGIVKGVIGLGFPIVVLAFLAATIGLQEAMGLLIVPGVVTNIWQALSGPAFGAVIRRIWTLLIASIAGIWLGVQILGAANPAWLTAILGGLLFMYSAVSLMRPQIPAPRKHERWLSPVIGATAGMMFGMTGSYMVPGVVYVQALGLSRDHFVQALGIIFCIIMAALALFMSQNRLLPLDVALMSAGGLIPIVLGMAIGQHYRRRLSEERFRTFLFIALCVAGAYMIVRSLA